MSSELENALKASQEETKRLSLFEQIKFVITAAVLGTDGMHESVRPEDKSIEETIRQT